MPPPAAPRPGTADRPAAGDPAARYWAAAAQRRLEVQRCARCSAWIHFPEPICPRCGSADLRFEAVSGLGQVETFTVIHRAFAAEVAAEVPYAVGFVALDDQPGLRLFADIVDVDPGEVRIGMPVQVTFTHRHHWGLVPSFRPRLASQTTNRSDEVSTSERS
jgi:uncharacterized OB-fold protein